MRTSRLRLLAALGAVTATTTGLVGASGAHAAPVELPVHCTTTWQAGGDFDWAPQVQLTVNPQKASYAPGDRVTVTWHWKTWPRNPSSWLLAGRDLARTWGTVRLTGSQTGNVPVTAAAHNDLSLGGQPITVADMTGTFTVAGHGALTLSAADYHVQFLQTRSDCAPRSAPVPALTLTAAGANGSAGTSPGGSATGTGAATGRPTSSAPTAPTAPGGNGPTPGPSSTHPDTPSATVPSASPSAADSSPLPTPTAPGSSSTAGASPAPSAASGPGAAPGLPGPGTAPGPLSMSPASSAPSGPPEPQRRRPHDQGVGGRLDPVLVRDQRGSSLGWDLTGRVSDFAPVGGGAPVPASQLSWTPTCVGDGPTQSPAISGSSGEVGDGPQVLCRQVASTGAVTGGTFEVNADLALDLPPNTPVAGGYTATLTLSLS